MWGVTVRLALRYQLANHPEIIQRQDAFQWLSCRLLFAIAAKLGCDLSEVPEQPEPLGPDFLYELVQIADRDAEKSRT